MVKCQDCSWATLRELPRLVANWQLRQGSAHESFYKKKHPGETPNSEHMEVRACGLKLPTPTYCAPCAFRICMVDSCLFCVATARGVIPCALGWLTFAPTWAGGPKAIGGGGVLSGFLLPTLLDLTCPELPP